MGWFQRNYDRCMEPVENRGLQRIRSDLLGKAAGRVLEIGSGTGVNFPYYTHAETVIAIEPNPVMRNKSLVLAKRATCPVTVRDGNAERLEFGDGAFDTVVSTLVLCTVPNPRAAVREMLRVCKPGGRLLLLEHVRMDRPVLGRLQDVLTPLWRKCFDGCCLNRDTVGLLEGEGVLILEIQSYYKGLAVTVVGTKS